MLDELRRRYVPNKVVAHRSAHDSNGHRSDALSGIFRGKTPTGPGPTVYVCEGFTCSAPVSGREAALSAWAGLGPPTE